MSGGEALPASVQPEARAVLRGADHRRPFRVTAPTLPRPGELVISDGFLLDAGGCAVNAAVILARLGVRTGLVGKVGDDEYGRWLRRSLARKRILVDGVSTGQRAATSQTVILPVDGEDRRYIHAPGADAELGVADIAPMLSGVRLLAIGGYLALLGLDPEGVADLLPGLAREGPPRCRTSSCPAARTTRSRRSGQCSRTSTASCRTRTRHAWSPAMTTRLTRPGPAGTGLRVGRHHLRRRGRRVR